MPIFRRKRPGRSECVVLVCVAVCVALLLYQSNAAAFKRRRPSAKGLALVAGSDESVSHLKANVSEEHLKRVGAVDPELDSILRLHSKQFQPLLFSYIPVTNTSLVRTEFPVAKLSKRGSVAAVRIASTARRSVCVTCYRLLSLHPRIYYFESVLTEEEAEYLIALGEPLLSRSGVFAKESIQRNVRSSSGARLPNSDRVVQEVDKRLLFIVNNFTSEKTRRQFRAGDSERLEVLRYTGAQNYNGHADNFGGIDGPIARQRRKRIARMLTEVHDETNKRALAERKALHEPLLDRGATMVVFLSDAPHHADADGAAAGGHTSFPFASETFDPTAPEYMDESSPVARTRWRTMLSSFDTSRHNPCQQRNKSSSAAAGAAPPFLMVAPRIGSAVLFYDLYENGVADPFALHSGCPPLPKSALARLVAEEVARDPMKRNASVWESLVAQQHVKYSMTKWFMLPIVKGVA